MLEFPFFAELHHLLSTRPNITPIAVITGIGPSGPKTIHYQPLRASAANGDSNTNSEPVIDPALIVVSYPPHPLAHHTTMENNSAMGMGPSSGTDAKSSDSEDKENIGISLKTPHGPKLSTNYGSIKLDNTVEKVKTSIKPLGKCSLIEDTFTEISR